MRKLGVLTALALLSSGLVVVTVSPAQASGGSLSSPNGVLYPGCRSHPYSYSVSLPPGADDWSLDVELYAPDGTYSTGDFVYDAPTSGSGTLLVCGSEMAGRWTIRGTVEYWVDWSQGSYSLPTRALTLRAPKSRTKIKAIPRHPHKNQVVKFKVRTLDERPNGYFRSTYPTVVLQTKRGGKWRKLKGSRTMGNDRGGTVIKVRYAGVPVKARAKSLRDNYTASTSKVLGFR
jgi:hypothetical protein